MCIRDRTYFNPLTFTYTPSTQKEFKLEDYSGKIENLGQDIDITLPSLGGNSSKTLASVPSRYITGILDIGITDKNVSLDENADPAKIHSQAMMRYNTLFTQTLTMTVPLNTNLIAGDIINCEFPRIDQQKRKEPDEFQSGLYLICVTSRSVFTELYHRWLKPIGALEFCNLLFWDTVFFKMLVIKLK